MRVTPRCAVSLAVPVILLLAGCATDSSSAAGSAPAPEALEVRKLDQAPVPRFQARPQYPLAMRQQKISGEVVVDFIIDTNGDVQNARALRSSRPEFESAAVVAVTKWKFKPGMKGGRPVPTRMLVPIVFTLNDPPVAPPAGPEGVSFEIPKAPMPPDTFDISQLDAAPVPRFQARPQYPATLRANGVAGEAVTDFIVDTEGNVQRAYAIRARHPAFGDAAVAAVMQWKFKPGMKGGRIVNTHMQVPIVFTLDVR